MINILILKIETELEKTSGAIQPWRAAQMWN
jgi:hypothetical protein